MPRRRAVTARPILPLADNFHEDIDAPEDDNEDDERVIQPSDTTRPITQSFRNFTLPQVTISRPGSPYVKPRALDDRITGSLSRNSSIASVGSSSRSTTTFKPLLPRDRNQASALSTASTSGSSPPRKAARLQDKEPGEELPSQGAANSASQASDFSEDHHARQHVRQSSSRLLERRAKPIRAVQTTKQVDPNSEPKVGRRHRDVDSSEGYAPLAEARTSGSKTTSSQATLRRSPRKSPGKAGVTDTNISTRKEAAGIPLRRSPRKSGQSTTQIISERTSPSRKAQPAAGRSIDAAGLPTTIPSSRTPSITELQGESIDTSGLQTGGTVIPRQRNTEAKAAGKKKKQADVAGAPSLTKVKRNGKSDLDLPSHDKVGQIRIVNAASDDSEGEQEPGKPPQRGAKRSSRPKSTASNRPPPVKPRRSKRKAERASSSEHEDEPAESTRQESEAPTTAAALVALLPKRKRSAKKKAQADDTSAPADDSLDSSVDDSRQYDRENWDSSASSSDKMESDETDYDDVEVDPTTKKVKEPPSKVQKVTAPLSRSKSVKPASSKPSLSTSKARSKTVIDFSDDEGKDATAKYGPGKERRKAYFAEVDDFKMDVELVV